jgi:hypothetical protein
MFGRSSKICLDFRPLKLPYQMLGRAFERINQFFAATISLH